MRLVESIYGRSMLLSLARGFKYFRNFHPDPRGNDPIWLVFSNGLKPPTRKKPCPPEKGPFSWEMSSSNHQFSGVCEFFRGNFCNNICYLTWKQALLSGVGCNVMRNVLQGFPCGRMMATLSSSEVKAIEQNCQDLCVLVLWAILGPPSQQLYVQGG